MNSASGRKGRLRPILVVALLATEFSVGTAEAQEAATYDPLPGMSATGVFGAQGGLTQTLGAFRSQMDGGGGVGFWLRVNAMRAPWDVERSFRFTLSGSLGMGTAGFEGAIASDGAYGIQWVDALADPRQLDTFVVSEDYAGEHAFKASGFHALFARIGYAGYLSHNDRVESSLVEVPRFEVGYQLVRGLALEARAHAGFVVTGQLSRVGVARELGMGVGWGGRVSMSGRSGSLELGLERLDFFADALGSVDIADARVCVFASRAWRSTFGMCATGRVEQAAFDGGAGRVAEGTSVYGGVLMGVGVH